MPMPATSRATSNSIQLVTSAHAAEASAEGADRLVAEEVLKRPDARLVAVLPLPGSDYETDFLKPLL